MYSNTVENLPGGHSFLQYNIPEQDFYSIYLFNRNVEIQGYLPNLVAMVQGSSFTEPGPHGLCVEQLSWNIYACYCNAVR